MTEKKKKRTPFELAQAFNNKYPSGSTIKVKTDIGVKERIVTHGATYDMWKRKPVIWVKEYHSKKFWHCKSYTFSKLKSKI